MKKNLCNQVLLRHHNPYYLSNILKVTPTLLFINVLTAFSGNNYLLTDKQQPEIRVNGVVSDQKGEPLTGVSVS